MEGKGENGIVEGASDCEDERARLRPADIDADVREMERRKRVEAMMSSRLFREELERIVEAQMRDGAAAVGPLLQQIQDMIQTGPARAHNSFSVKSTNCVIPINDIRGVESMGYAKGEKILRCKLAAVYRLMDLYGWTQGINNHITGRLNQEEEMLLVNAYGMLYHEVTASSLVKIDMQGNIVEPGTTNYGVNVQGFQLHAAIHQARPDIKCIIHVHTPSVLAVSSLKVGLLPLSNESVVIGEVSVHQSTGSIQEPEEKGKLARNLGPINKVMLLSNNGAVCCGETVEEAFFNVYNTVLACESQMKVMPLGVDNLVVMQDEVRKAIYDSAHRVPESTALPSTTGQPSENKEKRWRIGGLHFEALMRMLDNAGFRTGYIYRTPLVKGEPPKPKSDVEVPPAVSSLGYLLEEEEMYRNWKKMGGTKNDRTRWLNSPNVYQKVEILETGTPDPKKITKWVDANAEEWVADGSPTHSSTPVKISDALQFVPKNTNPKEFKKLQQQIKENRRADKITSGPQSHILEGVSWEEAKKLQDANIVAGGDQVVLVGAASKGIIQREFQHNATVYKTPYAKNPFDSISAQEIEDYKRSVTRKQRGESYDEDQSESEALSSSAALPPSGLKSPPSETDDDSRTEPRVLRIETKTAPIPSQAEYVLSDAQDVNVIKPKVKTDFNSVTKDGPRRNGTSERVRCYTRMTYTPTPGRKESPVIFDVTSVKPNYYKHIFDRVCSNCKKLNDTLYNSYEYISRSSQTVLSINEIEDKDLCDSYVSLSYRNEVRGKKRPVVRKLSMDTVIDELKEKFRSIGRYNPAHKHTEDNRVNNSEDGEIISCSVYKIPTATKLSLNYSGNDFTSDETTTTTETISSAKDTPHVTKTKQPYKFYIGDDFEGGEFLSENPQLSETMKDDFFSDSFVLSDFLSNAHINDCDSTSGTDINIMHYTNRIKKAFLIPNKFIQDKNSNTRTPESVSKTFYNSFHKMDIIDSVHSNECEGSLICDKNANSTCKDENNCVDEGCERSDRLNSLEEALEPSQKGLSDSSSLKLIVDGKDIFAFYREFDPNEVFQRDSDNFSMKAFYDVHSIHESGIDDDILTSICEEETIPDFTSSEPVVVDENIFNGKKYLLKRYLTGEKSNQDVLNNKFEQLSEDIVDSLDVDDRIEEKGNSAAEICCGISEDSAIFSALTMKTDEKVSQISMGYDHVVDWNLSNTSKEGSSFDSSRRSSGVRFSSVSDDDMPTRPTMSSIDEFLIKEIVCDSNPIFEPKSVCNSSLSCPVKETVMNSSQYSNIYRSLPNIHISDYKTSLHSLKNSFHFHSYRLPDVSTIHSYYTLAYLEKSLSMPDLIKSTNPTSNNLENPLKEEQCRVIHRDVLIELEDDVFEEIEITQNVLDKSEDPGAYISEEFICPDSESELSDGSNIHNFLNDSHNVNFDMNYNLINFSSDSECLENINCNLKIDANVLCDRTVENYQNVNDKTELYVEECDNESNIQSTKCLKDDLNKVNELTVNSCNKYVIDSIPYSLLDHDLFISNPISSEITLKENCMDFEHLKGCRYGFDCLICFATSMDESIDILFPEEKRRNKIIESLKKKFSKHTCILNNSRKPFRCNKKKSSYPDVSGSRKSKFSLKLALSKIKSNETSEDLSVSLENFPTLPLKSKFSGEITLPKLIYTGTYDISSSSCENVPSSSFSTHVNTSSYTTDSNKDAILNSSGNSLHRPSAEIQKSQENIKIIDQDRSNCTLNNCSFENNVSGLDHQFDQNVISERNESYKSASSTCSNETDYFSVIGDTLFKSAQSGSVSYGSNDETQVQSISTDFDEECMDSSDYSCTDHDTTFIIHCGHSLGLNYDTNYSLDDVDDCLEETEINVSSVSCQTDESFQDDSSFLLNTPDNSLNSSNENQPIFSEESNAERFNSSPDSTDSPYAHSRQRLFTIFETSSELSPEY